MSEHGHTVIIAMGIGGFRTFQNRFRKCHHDLLTDRGTSAMSDQQWSAMMRGDESYAAAKSFYCFFGAAFKVNGFKHITPTRQGLTEKKDLYPVEWNG